MAVNPKSLENLKLFTKEDRPKGGRFAGTRDKITKKFLNDLLDKYNQFGAEAIEHVAVNDPAKFITIVAGLLPKEATLDVRTSPIDELSVEQLAALSEGLAQLGSVILGDAEGFAEAVNQAELSQVH